MNTGSSILTFMRAISPDSKIDLRITGGQTVLRVDDIDLAVSGQGGLASAFAVTDLAVASVGTAALALAQLMSDQFEAVPAVAVDRRLASFWFASSLRPIGWELAATREAVTGDYACADGWVRLHANAAHHRSAALHVLGVGAGGPELVKAVSGWEAVALEEAVVQAGGCAAAMRTPQEWSVHPQGRAVAAEPVLDCRKTNDGVASCAFSGTRERPLKGLKVLDLTRVLAGPVSTRFLAAYGAQVLRIDPPFWSELGLEPEMTLGKRCARLDMRETNQREQMRHLLGQADVLVHGYRPGALEGLGLGAHARQQLRPGLIDVCLNAYGWTGPLSGRRGFDSLVQMSSGIAQAGMLAAGASRPTPLPVQALDQATGYLMAAAVIRGLTKRLRTGSGSMTRLSLARTASLLSMTSPVADSAPLQPETASDYADGHEITAWGPAHRLRQPCRVQGADMKWDYQADVLGSGDPRWLP